MSSRFVRGPLVYTDTTVKTTSGNVTVVNESQVIVKKDSGAATTVTLPAPTVALKGHTVIVKDGKGDAATNAITVAPDGTTATTIDGAATYTINTNYGSAAFTWNGTEWNVQFRGQGGTGANQIAQAGTAGSGTTAGGAGGAASLVAGAGGSKTGTGAAAGGAGGAVTVTGGAGGATASAGSDAGGAGGSVTITAGAGGAASAGTGNGGAGGTITLAPGAGGSSAGGSAGARGRVKVSGATLAFGNAQTIDMADAQVVLTMVPGTPAGTLITSNCLYVDANSGATEDLLLPPEADCNGLVLIIANTGGEDIVVKDDGDSVTICTLSATETAIVMCDGQASVAGVAGWRGGVLKTT